jgi:hypothetical protein
LLWRLNFSVGFQREKTRHHRILISDVFLVGSFRTVEA